MDGDPVGTVRHDAETQCVAHRIDLSGVAQWRISQATGEQYGDLSPTLAWPVLYEP